MISMPRNPSKWLRFERDPVSCFFSKNTSLGSVKTEFLSVVLLKRGINKTFTGRQNNKIQRTRHVVGKLMQCSLAINKSLNKRKCKNENNKNKITLVEMVWHHPKISATVSVCKYNSQKNYFILNPVVDDYDNLPCICFKSSVSNVIIFATLETTVYFLKYPLFIRHVRIEIKKTYPCWGTILNPCKMPVYLPGHQ